MKVSTVSKIIIKLSGKRRGLFSPIFNIYIDGRLRGEVSERNPQLTVEEVPDGEHVVQVKNGLLAGMSMPVKLVTSDASNHVLTVSRKSIVRFILFAIFIGIYSWLRIGLQQSMPIAALAAAVALGIFFAMVPSIELKQTESSS